MFASVGSSSFEDVLHMRADNKNTELATEIGLDKLLQAVLLICFVATLRGRFDTLRQESDFDLCVESPITHAPNSRI